MKNLKRILSLALASVMVMGMMVVGASATRFVDDADIENQTAVSTLDALGIMQGDERGFRPGDTLTRAEATKMLAKIHNKGRDVNYGTPDNPSFTDIKGHWAEGIIEYAAAFGIANGKGNGIFDPQGDLKVVELVRMALNMMGYTEGQTGSDWEIQTTVLADNLELFDGLDSYMPSAKVTRDQAAQILVNAIDAPVANGNTVQTVVYVVKTKGTDTAKQGDIASLVNEKFDTYFEAYTLAEALKGEDGKIGTDYEIEKESSTASETLGAKYLGLDYESVVVTSVTPTRTGFKVNNTYEVTEDPSDLMGLKVTAIVKKNAAGTITQTYGFTTVGTVICTGIWADKAAEPNANGTIYIGGTAVGYNALTTATWNGLDVEAEAYEEYYDLKVISNSANGKIDLFLVTPVTVAEVTRVGNTTITAGSTYSFEDDVIPAGIAVGDWVTIRTDLDNETAILEILEPVEGATPTVLKDGIYTIDGEQYALTEGVSDLTLGVPYDLIALNGYIFSADESSDAPGSATIDKLVYATRVADPKPGTNDLGGDTATETQQVELLFTDNTKQIVTVDKLNGTAVKKEADPNKVEAGKLYTYATKDGKYQLTDAPTTGTLGSYAAVDAESDNLANGRIDTVYINNDAVLFVVLTKDGAAGDVKVLTGAEVAAWTTVTEALKASSTLYTESKNGFSYTVAGILYLANTAWPGTVSDDQYGYVTADGFEIYNSTLKGTYIQVSIWNGTETVTVLMEVDNDFGDDGLAHTDIVAGQLVKYAEDDDNVLAEFEILTGTPDAVTAYAGGEDILFETTSGLTSLKNVKIFFIDDTKKVGVPASEAAIERAEQDPDEDEAKLLKNVYIVNDDGTYVLYVDVNGEVADQGEDDEVEVEPHAHSYVWTVITAENKGESLTEGQHIQMCATDNETTGTAHAAATSDEEKSTDGRDQCTLCQALSFNN